MHVKFDVRGRKGLQEAHPSAWSLPPPLGTSENREVQQKECGCASVDFGASQVVLVVKDPPVNAGEV